MIFLEKKVMERVEQIIEISSKLEKIEQFCKFIEDVNKIAKCKRSDCPIGPYSDKLKVVFDHMLDCNVHRIFFIEFSIEFSEIFSAMFRLQKKGKKNVKGIVDSFEAEAKRKQKKEQIRTIYFEFYSHRNKKLKISICFNKLILH